MRPPKRVNLSSGREARVKTESKNSPRLTDAADNAHHTERPTTPKGQTLNSTIYPTPSSPIGGLPAKEPSYQSHFVNPKSPIWNSGNSLEPELPDDDDRDPSWDSPKSLKRGRSLSKGADDDDLYRPPSKAVKTAFSRRQLLLTGADDGLSDDEDDEYEYDDERGVSKKETKGVVYDFSLERAKRWAAAVSLPEDAWGEAEKELFFRLAMRGFEPLLPRHWQHDFSTLPDTMFSLPEDEAIPIIRAFKHSDFHAIKSLLGLFSLGGQVRDCNFLRTRPEDKIRRAIKKYVHWAMRDADIHNKPGTIPVYTIRAQKEGESVVYAVSELNNRLGKLAKRYHDALGMSLRSTSPRKVKTAGAQIKQELDTDMRITSRRNFPLLVGFVICGPIVAILTLDTDPLSPKGWGEGTGSKFISQFDVGERGQDVWTSLALAITIMHIRKTVIQLADGGKGGFCRNGGDVLVGEDEDL
ncbi:uncharacterized protein ASPGLDRAFT_132849 [Aspergillus glaucus CBS 516.65]|uniref:Uncharacterized protein n=1 Tax=Aspergillus glaucus CBS 516.65 TaxID=1160497 RepID=A0A1L9VBX8_ASPGL|nr:hypothetical protein ASPGLDRAFT_132849 [Aspergillus glaucus CBS 516.65]OJJ81352.1 hypothetical protein ASPGLDRAFT_132849 [Aspergillus glaucus CBS 516.65]